MKASFNRVSFKVSADLTELLTMKGTYLIDCDKLKKNPGITSLIVTSLGLLCYVFILSLCCKCVANLKCAYKNLIIIIIIIIINRI